MIVLFPAAGVDYIAVTGMTLSFSNGGSQMFPVVTIEDDVVEVVETLSVVIDIIRGPATPGPELSLTILDDDSKLTDNYSHLA